MNTQTDRGLDPALLQDLFDGGFETPLWRSFLDRLRMITGADYAMLTYRPPGRAREDSVDLISGDVAPTAVQETYAHLPGPPPGSPKIENRPYTLHELLGSDGSAAKELYHSLVDEHGVRGIRQMRVREASGVDAWLTLARRGADFTPRVDQLMRSLAPPLRSALRHHVAFERERFAASISAEAIRRLQFGWFTLDQAGQVLDCDPQGMRVLSESGVLARTAAGRLCARPATLEREILATLARMGTDPQSRARAMTLSRDPWLDLLLIPARGKSVMSATKPVATAFVHGDNWRSADRSEQLAQLFGLLPREARLALALCRGMTIAEAAAEFGLTVESARTYTKGIYQKTGARGLPDLVRIVMRSVLAIAPDA